MKGLGPTLKVIAGADFRQVRKVRAAEPESGAGAGGAEQGAFGVVRGDEVGCS